MTDPRVITLCEEFSIQIIGKSTYPMPGQTRAVETMARIIRRHGIDHMRLVLTTLRETANNAVLLDESGLWSASDMIRAWQATIDDNASQWLALWDRMEVGRLQFTAQRLSGFTPVRYALGGMLHERIYGEFGDRGGPVHPDLFDRRAA